MALILTIDTATKNCSVALSKDGLHVDSIDYNDGNFSHSEKLHVFIEELCERTGHKLKDLNAVAISKGPGSYTGLRIGVSAAKGLCYGLDIPLISIETLEVLTKTYLLDYKVKDQDILIPMLDARRMEVYTAVYNAHLENLEPTNALVLDNSSYATYLNNNHCHFIGDGATKTSTLFANTKHRFIDHLYPSAAAMHQVVFEKYKTKSFEDVAYFEPYYLKDFVDGNKNK